MYCIDTSNNSRSVYKGGLMGINPNGEYLYTLYESDQVSRTVIHNMEEGEYVFDAIRGDFYKSAGDVNNRSLSDDDLVEIDFDSPENYFNSDDYSSSLLGLLNKINNNNSIYTESETISMLNYYLDMAELIDLLSFNYTLSIPEEDIEQIIEYLKSAQLDEIIDFNRELLYELFPDLAPSLMGNSVGFVEIVPLMSCNFDNVNDAEETDAITESRSLTLSGYETQKNDIYKTFSKYTEFAKLTIPKLKSKNGFSLKLSHATAKLGVKGSFDITWSKLKTSIHTAVLLEASTDADITGEYNINLFEIEEEATYPVYAVGPLVLNLKGVAGFKVPLKVKVVSKVNSKIYFSGIYGAGFKQEAKWGTKWSGKWWKRRLKPYFKCTWSDGETVNKTAYYIGTDTPSLEFKKASISISPEGKLLINTNINTILFAELVQTAGIKNVLSAEKEGSYLVGRASSDLYLKTYYEAGVRIKIPLLGTKKVTKKETIDEYNKNLGSSLLFKKKL